MLIRQSLIFQRLRFITNCKIKFNLFGVLRCFCYFHTESDALFLYSSSLVELGSISAALSLGGARAHFPNFRLVIEPRVLTYLTGKSQLIRRSFKLKTLFTYTTYN